MLDPDEPARLKERQRVRRVVEHVAEVLVEEVELLTELVVVGDVVLVRNDDGRSLLVEGAELYAWGVGTRSLRGKEEGKKERDGPSSSFGTLAVFWNW